MTDTSNEYIAMCDCPEVQGRWQLKFGDVMKEIYSGEIDVIDLENRIQFTNDIGLREHVRRRYVYLPDQRTLQEWTVDDKWECDKWDHLLDSFYEWHHVCGMANWTFEMNWLAYFMDTVHNLEWEGGKWITN